MVIMLERRDPEQAFEQPRPTQQRGLPSPPPSPGILRNPSRGRSRSPTPTQSRAGGTDSNTGAIVKWADQMTGSRSRSNTDSNRSETQAEIHAVEGNPRRTRRTVGNDSVQARYGNVIDERGVPQNLVIDLWNGQVHRPL